MAEKINTSEARELDLALMMADLCGYTALTETHGALLASEAALRFVRLAEECLEPGVRIYPAGTRIRLVKCASNVDDSPIGQSAAVTIDSAPL